MSPLTPPDRRLTKRVEVAFHPDDVAAIDKAARAVGLNRAEFVRMAAVKAAKEQT